MRSFQGHWSRTCQNLRERRDVFSMGGYCVVNDVCHKTVTDGVSTGRVNAHAMFNFAILQLDCACIGYWKKKRIKNTQCFEEFSCCFLRWKWLSHIVASFEKLFFRTSHAQVVERCLAEARTHWPLWLLEIGDISSASVASHSGCKRFVMFC